MAVTYDRYGRAVWQSDIRQAKQVISTSLSEERMADTAGMVFELYRDKVLTGYQAKEILLAMGCTTISDTCGNLKGYY